jgi:murein DD-endopeptidase MepM/ murein hydrolase activator NlpD
MFNVRHRKYLKRFILMVLSGLLGLILIGFQPAQVNAAPVAPEVAVIVNPEIIRPAQAGYVAISGKAPLRVSVTLDGESLPVFWSGESYMALFSFGFDAEPGDRRLEIAIDDPLTGQNQITEKVLTVVDFQYPRESVALPFSLIPLLDADLNNSENAYLAEAFSGYTRPGALQIPFDSPVPGGVLTSRFGGDRSYNTGLWRQYHAGADFRRTIGEPIYAVADGVVVVQEGMEIYGGVVVLDHGYGVYSLYAHVSEHMIRLGDTVKRGQLIALAGTTGRANGPHLHFEIIVNGNKVDPVAWLALDPAFVPLREVPATRGEGESDE